MFCVYFFCCLSTTYDGILDYNVMTTVCISKQTCKKTFPNLSYFYVKCFHKTFWGTTKKCRNKNFKLFFILLSPLNTIYTSKWFRYFEDKTIHVFHRWKTCLRFLQRNFFRNREFSDRDKLEEKKSRRFLDGWWVEWVPML